MRVTRSRELVAEGDRPSVVARVAQISRQAIDRVPKPGRAPASPTRPPVEEVEAAIVAEAEANPTDGYRMVTAWVRRRLGRSVNRKRVLRVMRERRLTGGGARWSVGGGRGSSASSARISSGTWTSRASGWPSTAGCT
jgi:HTH-like domain